MKASTKAPFHVNVLGFSVLKEIPGSWTAADYRKLLGLLEFDDIAGLSEAELPEMCVLALQDLEPAKAAQLILQQRLGDALSKGQIQNTSHEMLDEKLWEEYVDMPLHERFFHVASLLYQAFPRICPVPDAVDVQLEVSAGDGEGQQLLAAPLHESLVVRLLAHGMPDTAALNRVFGEAVQGKPFPEAESIVWIAEGELADAGSLRLHIIGSGYWLDSLRQTKSYASSARPDLPKHA